MTSEPIKRRLGASASFVRRHPWWRRLTKTPLSAKMTKYAVGSLIAFVTGNVFFAFVYWATAGDTFAASVAGFVSAAIPNWILNRRWAWQQTGPPPAKQVITYAGVSLVVLFTTSWATGVTNSWVKHMHVEQHYGLRILIVTAAYVAVTVVLFFAKFAIYEFWVFSERSRVRSAFRSLMNVSRIARANRIP